MYDISQDYFYYISIILFVSEKISGPPFTIPLLELSLLKSPFLRKERAARLEDPRATGKEFVQDQVKAAPKKQL